MSTPLLAYSRVPKAFLPNLDYRRRILRAAVGDCGLQDDLRAICAEDVLYWVNVFAWTFNPRRTGATVLPFITWPFQDEAILEVERGIEEGHDLLIEKSRDMGATWLTLLVFDHRFLFRFAEAYLLVSRKEDLVYKDGDQAALFSKLEFLHDRLPLWMMPGFSKNVHMTRLHLLNPATLTTIDGEATGGDIARGDRRTAILLDEFAAVDVVEARAAVAATGSATNCRLFNSTPRGAIGPFYELRQRGCRRLTLHWSRHPEKARGLYLDAAGKPRSPWYDAESKRCLSVAEVAQEQDIDYLGSSYQFYPPALIDAHRRDFAVAPYSVGDLDYVASEAEPKGFVDNPHGMLKLWLKLSTEGRPPGDRSFVVGVDVGMGTGASNSVAVVADRRTRELVAEHAVPTLRPEIFAELVVALCKWFGGEDGDGAYLTWEANGPGRAFGDRVQELGYRNFYFRTNEQAITKKVSDIPGWWSSRPSRMSLHGAFRRVLKDGEFVCRSAAVLGECLEYVVTVTGDLAHSKALSSVDPTGARENHADRVVAAALACWGLREYRVDQKASEGAAPPPGSLAYRRKAREARETESKFW